MNEPIIAAKEFAGLFNLSSDKIEVYYELKGLHLPRMFGLKYLNHQLSSQLTNKTIEPQIVNFHIVKGGTGKTSLAREFALCAYSLGFKVLCVDLDQQGNLTQSFDVNPYDTPVMIDLLMDGYPISSSIINIFDDLHIIPSRIENSMLDECIRLKGFKLNEVFDNIKSLKRDYDLIILDCPPSLGFNVTAANLCSDRIIAPVNPENFALSGLINSYKSLIELSNVYKKEFKFNCLFNKFDNTSYLSKQTLELLSTHPIYSKFLLSSYVRHSQEFTKAVTNNHSIFNNPRTSFAKEDVLLFSQEILGLYKINLQTKEENNGIQQPIYSFST